MKPDDREFMQKISRDLQARKAACRIFNVKETASKQEMKKAFRKEAIKYHPDKNPDDPDADRKFALIKCAYELLTTDKPCPELLEEINAWNGVPEQDKYKLDNPWGHFLWWREKFFGPDREKKSNGKRSSCI